MKKNWLYHAVALMLVIFLLQSYSSTRTIYELNYNVKCINCGTTADGFLIFDVSTKGDPARDLIIKIKNNIDEMRLLDERYYTLTDEDIVVLNPIGYENPNTNFTPSSQYRRSSATHTQYLYIPLGRYFNRYNYAICCSSGQSVSTIQQPFLVVPSSSSNDYEVKDCLYSLMEKEKELLATKFERYY